MKALWKPIIAACVIAFVSCRKEVPLPDPSLKKIFGQWEWIKSSGGKDHLVMTPFSEGYARVIEFSPDGMYRHYRSDRPAMKMTFHFEKKDDGLPLVPAYEIVYSAGRLSRASVTPQLFYFRGDDTLILHDDCADFYQHVYVRR